MTSKIKLLWTPSYFSDFWLFVFVFVFCLCFIKFLTVLPTCFALLSGVVFYVNIAPHAHVLRGSSRTPKNVCVGG